MEKKRNLWVIPTDKPSRLHKYDFDGFALSKEALNWKEAKNIYITNSEEIKEEDWVYDKILNSVFKFESGEANDDYIVKNIKKIILTTDQDLIKDGVQAIPDEFLQWFVKNPSCEFVETLFHYPTICDEGDYSLNLGYWTIIIPKEEPKQDIIMELQKDPLLKDFDNQVNKKISFLKQKQETLEEAKLNEKEFYEYIAKQDSWKSTGLIIQEFIQLKLKEQDKNKYSEEDLHNAFYNGWIYRGENYTFPKAKKEWFEQFKKK